MSNYKNPVCRSIHGCGRCERCAERRCQAAAAEKSDTHHAPIESLANANIGTAVAGLPVKGYRKEQPQWAVDLVNENKRLEELVLRQIDKHQQMYAAPADGSENPPQHQPCVDMRNVALARTAIEDAFMRLNRAVFRPQRLEGDL